MKASKIIKALGQIDERYILEADSRRKSRAALYFAAGGGLAAAVFVAVLSVGIMLRTSDNLVLDGAGASLSTSNTAGEQTSSNTAESEHDGAGESAPSKPQESEPQGNTPAIPTEVEIDYAALPFDWTSEPAVLEYLMFAAGSGAGGAAEGFPDWNECMVITELPVFKGGFSGVFCAEDYIKVLQGYAERLGEELSDIDVWTVPDGVFGPGSEGLSSGLTARAGEVTFTVDIFAASGGRNITIGLPEEVTAERAAEILGYSSPVVMGSGKRYVLYDAPSDLYSAFLNYFFKSAEVSGSTIRTSAVYETMECIGMYPTVSFTKAKEKLLSGDIKSAWKNEPFSEKYEYTVTLAYEFSRSCEYILPFYEFTVERDYGRDVYYVPAVADEYIAKSENIRLN